LVLAAFAETIRRVPARPVLASRHALWAEGVLLTAILVLAVAFRFATIGSKSFWYDEAFSANAASRPIPEIVALTAREDAHPPLYYIALAAWGRVVGTSDVALRSLGAIASLGTVLATWWIGRRLGGHLIGALAAFLTATSPFQVLAAQEARMYVLLGLLTVLAWAALLVALEGRRGGWIAYVIATTLALYTHYFAGLTLLGHALFVQAVAPRRRQQWLLAQLAVLLLYVPWIGPSFNVLSSGRGGPFFRPPLGAETITSLLGFLSFGGHAFGFMGWFGGTRTSLVSQVAVLLPFLALAVLGAVSIWNRPSVRWFLIGYLVVPVAAVFAVSVRYNVFYPRYFSFVYPPFALLLAFGIGAITSRVPPSLRRASILTSLLVFVAVSGWALQEAYTNPKYDLFNWRRVATLLADDAGPNDLIVLTPAFAELPFMRYFHGSQPVVPITPLEIIDPTVPAQPDPAAQARNREVFSRYASQHEVMWVVITVPYPRYALDRFERLLKGIYDVQGIADFNGILIVKMPRHRSEPTSHP